MIWKVTVTCGTLYGLYWRHPSCCFGWMEVVIFPETLRLPLVHLLGLLPSCTQPRLNGKVVLTINTNKAKVPSVTGHHPLFICIIMQNIVGVNQVVHLSVVCANGSNSNTKSTFIALSKIWKCNYLDTNIKLGLCSRSSSIHMYVGLSGYSGLRQ